MKCPFDNEAWSFVNRILDLFARTNVVTGEVANKNQEEAYNREAGWFPQAYGYKNGVLLATLWSAADMNADWGGESEMCYEENGDYPVVAKAWNISTGWDLPKGEMPEPYRMAEDAISDAVAVCVEFENKLWLACLVANAIEVLEGGLRNTWGDLLPEVNLEFESERKRTHEAAKEILSPWQDGLFHKAFNW
jgi:hypothetical protein